VRDWRRDNPEYYTQRYADDNTNSKRWTKRWKQNNPDKVALLVDRRRDILKQATPLWFERDKVQIVYKKRDELKQLWDVDLTVDHVIPLQGKTICGLHCWLNLQLIERRENGRKHNKSTNS
jgi:5-methylcytosine-specific restriction endonuclease McrA